MQNILKLLLGALLFSHYLYHGFCSQSQMSRVNCWTYLFHLAPKIPVTNFVYRITRHTFSCQSTFRRDDGQDEQHRGLRARLHHRVRAQAAVGRPREHDGAHEHHPADRRQQEQAGHQRVRVQRQRQGIRYQHLEYSIDNYQLF